MIHMPFVLSNLLDVTLDIHNVMTFRKINKFVSALYLRFNEFPDILVLSANFKIRDVLEYALDRRSVPRSDH